MNIVRYRVLKIEVCEKSDNKNFYIKIGNFPKDMTKEDFKKYKKGYGTIFHNSDVFIHHKEIKQLTQ